MRSSEGFTKPWQRYLALNWLDYISDVKCERFSTAEQWSMWTWGHKMSSHVLSKPTTRLCSNQPLHHNTSRLTYLTYQFTRKQSDLGWKINGKPTLNDNTLNKQMTGGIGIQKPPGVVWEYRERLDTTQGAQKSGIKKNNPVLHTEKVVKGKGELKNSLSPAR